MGNAKSITATEFKAKCLDILDRVSRREVERVTITKRGKIVAVVTPPESEASRVRQIHGYMRGSVVIHDDLDLTAPIVGEPFAAARGKVHE
jgi:prevent-host-death family protein